MERKSSDKEKASCCGSHEGSMLGSPFKEELAVQLQGAIHRSHTPPGDSQPASAHGRLTGADHFCPMLDPCHGQSALCGSAETVSDLLRPEALSALSCVLPLSVS